MCGKEIKFLKILKKQTYFGDSYGKGEGSGMKVQDDWKRYKLLSIVA